jgi:hypothetical protein
LGPEAKTRVWLVLDNGVLYADRNGNGDLAEPGEQVKGTPALLSGLLQPGVKVPDARDYTCELADKSTASRNEDKVSHDSSRDAPSPLLGAG